MRGSLSAGIGMLLLASIGFAPPAGAGERMRVQIRSSLDQSPQPCDVILPPAYDPQGSPLPLLVSLHSWSAGVDQPQDELERLVAQRGWIYLYPHFRGPNNRPEACGSALARQDILDAVQWARKQYRVDARRIYLTGASGGGHMTMLMVGRHPEIWAAASAWVGISDLTAWHQKHAETRYGDMLRKSCGGAPGDSRPVDRQYHERSPVHFLHHARHVPLDLAAGVHDGHTGSVPIRHSLKAFNIIARTRGAKEITEDEIAQLSRRDGRLEKPQPSDQARDASLGRAIYLRRHAGPSRVTIFEGGHERIARAAVDWLAQHRRP